MIFGCSVVRISYTVYYTHHYSKVLFAATMVLSVIMMCLKGFNGPWYFYLFRFVLLFSYLIPISLRVNLDIAKIYHSMCIQGGNSIDILDSRRFLWPFFELALWAFKQLIHC